MNNVKFEPLVLHRASTNIEKNIKEAILNGRLKEGDRLPTEKQMAAQFGVSVVTLREALRSLEIFGLIEKRKGQGGGIFVSRIDSEAIKTSLGYFLSFKDLTPQHLLEVRIMIEPPAILLAAQKISPDEIKRLEENVQYCEEKIKNDSAVLTENGFFDVDRKNIDFHRIIAESTHNPILSLTVDYVFDFLYECEKNVLIPDVQFSMDTIRAHKKILEYLKKGDGEQCQKEMALHLKEIDTYLTEMGKKKDNQSYFRKERVNHEYD